MHTRRHIHAHEHALCRSSVLACSFVHTYDVMWRHCLQGGLGCAEEGWQCDGLPPQCVGSQAPLRTGGISSHVQGWLRHRQPAHTVGDDRTQLRQCSIQHLQGLHSATAGTTKLPSISHIQVLSGGAIASHSCRIAHDGLMMLAEQLFEIFVFVAGTRG